MNSPTIRTIAALACMVTLAGCATSPIGVRRMDPDAVSRALTANALTTDTPSISTTNVLHRRGLYLKFQKQPVWTLAELHRLALLEDDDDAWFALAELSFLHADRTGDRKYSVMAAIYAWSFLFGGVPPEPFDPRLRLATDIYNRGLTQGLETSREKGIELAGSITELPIGQVILDFDTASLEWNGRHLHDFVPVAELQVNGLANRFRSPGIGAPLAASAAVDNPDESSEFLAPRLRTPVTAVVRFDDIRRQVARGKIHATLELHTDPNEESITIEGRRVPLEREPTAALASMLAEAPVIKQEIYAFLGTLTQRQGKGRLAAMRPHVRGRIPVVFVHGTASSPARWAEMVNVLDNDPRINRRFEPWFFSYNSSSPIIYSSYLLRRAMLDAVQMIDPEGTDPGLREMVVIGHSQGGLLTKMTAVHSGDEFWKGISPKPFDQLKLEDDKRELMREVMFVEPLPFVSRLVFICTPHRGSYLAASGWVRRLITRLVSLPVTVTAVTGNLLTLNPDLTHLQSLSRVNAVDNMTPGNRFVQALSRIPVAPTVPAHSIIAVQTKGPIEEGNDGVVEYSSAHIEGVESEKVVHSSHSTQALPDTIEEVRRILLEHAAQHQVPMADDEEPTPTAAKASNAGRRAAHTAPPAP